MIVVLDTGHVWDQGSVNFMPYVGEYTGAADIWAPTLRHACQLNREFEVAGFVGTGDAWDIVKVAASRG